MSEKARDPVARVGGTQVTVEPAAGHEVARLIAIHREGIPYSFNSRLGLEHMTRLYDVLLADPASVVLAARTGDAPVGVCIATLDADALSRTLMRSISLPHWLRIAGAAARSPRLVANWLEGVWVGRPVFLRGQIVRACLFAIAVDGTIRSQGIGAALVHGVDDFCRRAGCPSYRLDTRMANKAAQRFYEREGFFNVGRRGRNTIWVRDLAA